MLPFFPFADIGRKECLCMAPLALMIIWLGVYPEPVLNYIQQITGAP